MGGIEDFIFVGILFFNTQEGGRYSTVDFIFVELLFFNTLQGRKVL